MAFTPMDPMEMDRADPRTLDFYAPILMLGLIQGLALSLTIHFNEVLTPVNGTLIVSLVMLILSLQLLGGPGKWRAAIGFALPFIGVIGSVTFLRLNALGPWNVAEESQFFLSLFWFLLAGPMVWLVLMAFAQAFVNDERTRDDFYARFYHFSWATVPLLFFALLFSVVGVTLLGFAAYLLASLNIPLFWEAYSNFGVFLTMACVLFAFGIAVLRGRHGLFERLSIGLKLICRVVVYGLGVFAVVFLAALPFSGTGSVAQSAPAALVFLCLGSLTIVAFNGAFQAGEDSNVSSDFRAAAIVSLAVLPIYAVLGLLSIYARYEQYGLTPERFTMFTLLSLLLVIGLVYVMALLWEVVPRQKSTWLSGIRTVNPSIAVTIAMIFLLMQTTILDPVAWSARNQLDRIMTERAAAEAQAFDYGYLYFKLGQEGRRALSTLEALDAHPQHEAIRQGIYEARRFNTYRDYRQSSLAR